jgi:Domain of unknown function (DUF4169)
MAEVVNLRTARKRAKRQKDALLANTNRLAHGRPRSAQALDEARQAKADSDLEQHRTERGDGR